MWTLLIFVGFWLGYYLGFRDGKEQEKFKNLVDNYKEKLKKHNIFIN